ncbi:MAG: hypothetical protein KAW45_03590 [Thermoplasmatales archaeon]|nr:hypothetical protein [Thermoplasmatales archaeon]
MKPVSIELEKINEKYYLNIPKAIVELMGWSEGDVLLIPFYEISKKDDYARRMEIAKVYKNEIEVNIGDKPFKITREQVIELLENPTPDLFNYRTAFIEWEGEKFGSKAVCKKLFGQREFNTITGEHYLKQLGFPPKRKYDLM